MEFGKVSEHELRHIDFTLPEDGEQTIKTLNGLKPAKSPAFYIGCAKWGRKEWINMIYPPKTKEADFLDQYVKHFNSIELNTVFYSIPAADLIRKWRDKAAANSNNNFLFFPKFSRTISHIKRLKDAEEATDLYISSIVEFGEYLGPCFLQMGDNFGPKNIDVLEKFLKYLPQDLSVFVELRHADWFKMGPERTQLFEMLARLKKGALITDASGRRDCVHMELTIPEAFIRFVGNGQAHKASDEARIDEWVIRLKHWLDKGLQKVYFFLHQHDEMDTPVIADYTIEQFNKHLGSHVDRIAFINGKNAHVIKQAELF